MANSKETCQLLVQQRRQSQNYVQYNGGHGTNCKDKNQKCSSAALFCLIKYYKVYFIPTVCTATTLRDFLDPNNKGCTKITTAAAGPEWDSLSGPAVSCLRLAHYTLRPIIIKVM